MLSLFFNNPQVFTEEVIVDELIDFFIAGTQTLAFSIQAMICHFATAPESLEKVRKELIETAKESEFCYSKEKVLENTMQLETLGDLPYLSWVTMEVLRFRPPAATSSIIELT